MATNRILYTLSDIKDILSKKHNIDKKDVCVYNNYDICVKEYLVEYEITDDHYILQVDTDNVDENV